MAVVTEHLTSLISKAVTDHGVVVWYDTERDFARFAESFDPPGVRIARYTDSFFALRREIEPFLSGPEPGRVVVYVPVDRSATQDALVEAEAAGKFVTFPLATIAMEALAPFIGVKNAAALEKDVQAGTLTLEDLDRLDLTEGVTRGVVALILGSGNVQDIALRFLSGERYDADIVGRNATAELAMLLNNGFGSSLSAADSPGNLRSEFAWHVLATEFVFSLTGPVPQVFATVKVAEKQAAKKACVALVTEWRGRQDLRESYAKLSDAVGSQLQLWRAELPLDLIVKSETFRQSEVLLCKLVTAGLLEEPTQELVAIAQSRQSSFWSEHLPDVQARWAMIAVAGQLLLEAAHLEQESGKTTSLASDWVKYYALGERPWCLLDTHHRHLERRYHNFDFQPGEDGEQLSQLVAKARRRYMEAGGLLSDKFLRRLRDEHFRLSTLSQREIYERKVRPRLETAKTAYVWVDALRFEMGRELADSLGEDFEVNCEPAIALPPTITEIGMAALLPGNKESISETGPGRLGLTVDGTLIKGRKDRIAFLEANAGVNVLTVKLEELLPKPKKKLEERIRGAQLILMTSQEIDELCEGDNVPFARSRMDSILRDLQRAARSLAACGVERFVVAADHGYIFGEDLDDSMKIDPPGGETLDLHRRVWVGRGGGASDSFLRATLRDFGIDSDLEIATPWGFGAFKSPGGAKAFFHGGISLQELVIPVVTLEPHSMVAHQEARYAWTLTPGSKSISTRFFSVQVKGAAADLFEAAPPKVRIEVRLDGNVISTPVSASYGFEEATADVQLRTAEDGGREIEPNTITLLISDTVSRGTASVHLLDASSGAELGRVPKIEIAISI